MKKYDIGQYIDTVKDNDDFFRNYYLQERFRYGCLRVLWQQDRLHFSCMTELMNMYRAACGIR